MFDEIPSANKASHVYKFDPPTNTNNQHLGLAAVALERIYKTIDWPFAAPIDQGDLGVDNKTYLLTFKQKTRTMKCLFSPNLVVTYKY